MSLNIKQYEANLNTYKQKVEQEKSNIASAEKNLLVAETNLKNYESQMKELEKTCNDLTGKSISDLETVIKDNMDRLEQLMKKVEVAEVTASNVSTYSDDELMENMQFAAEEI